MALTVSRIASGAVAMAWPATTAQVMVHWSLNPGQVGLVQTVANVAHGLALFVAGWGADRYGAARVFRVSNWLAAVAFVGCVVFARTGPAASILFALLLACLGGAYAPALMLAAGNAPEGRRGAAVGWTLGGAFFGYFVVLVGAGLAGPNSPPQYLWCWLVPLALLAALTGDAAARRCAPPPKSQPASRSDLGKILRSRTSVLLTLGYSAHAWELLGMWAWAPAFLLLVLHEGGMAPVLAGLVTAAALHLSGALATLTSGAMSDRCGRRPTLVALALGGAACSFAFGWLQPFGAAVLVLVAVLYGFTTVGDSVVLKTAMVEATPPDMLGRVLAVRSIVGFSVGALAPGAVGLVLDATNPGDGVPQVWGWGFAALGCGGLLAAGCGLGLRPARAGREALEEVGPSGP
ncbi:MFS transporter [Brevundimonas diminuta]|nr:MFS transporter [Brevundimonas diminuta]